MGRAPALRVSNYTRRTDHALDDLQVGPNLPL